MSLIECARLMLREIETLAKWEAEILRDLAKTKHRRAELSRALDTLIPELPDQHRRKYRQTLTRIDMAQPERRQRPSVMTPKVSAVHDYLAQAEDTVSVFDLQRHLIERGLSTKPHDAYNILARKVGQGMVARISKGVYRVNPSHREIVERRRELRKTEG